MCGWAGLPTTTYALVFDPIFFFPVKKILRPQNQKKKKDVFGGDETVTMTKKKATIVLFEVLHRNVENCPTFLHSEKKVSFMKRKS